MWISRRARWRTGRRPATPSTSSTAMASGRRRRQEQRRRGQAGRTGDERRQGQREEGHAVVRAVSRHAAVRKLSGVRRRLRQPPGRARAGRDEKVIYTITGADTRACGRRSRTSVPMPARTSSSASSTTKPASRRPPISRKVRGRTSISTISGFTSRSRSSRTRFSRPRSR